MIDKAQKSYPNEQLKGRGVPQSYCRAAFNQLHISIGGDVKPCCEFATSIGNIQKQSLTGIWFSDAFEQLRTKMLQGERDVRCWKCDEKEDAGVFSLRDMYNEKIFSGDTPSWSEGKDKTELPKALDIRLSNLCNLSCRTCGPEASSKWHSDAKQLGWWDCGPHAINDTFPSTAAAIETLSTTLNEVEEIYFAGGEPLLHEGHYAVLNELLRLGRTHVRLYYNTNLTSLKLNEMQVLPLWSKFKAVHVGASIDGYEERGELIRQGLSWKQFTKNVSTIRMECPSAQIRFSITVSVLNVFSLPELCERLQNIPLIDKARFTFNILQEPRFYSIQILPMHMKLRVKRRLEQYGAKHALLEEFGPIIRFMMFEDRSSELETFRTSTLKLDKLRNQNTAKTIPEIGALLGRRRDQIISDAIMHYVRTFGGAIRSIIVSRPTH